MIEFVKQQGPYDSVSLFVNGFGNGLALVAASTATATITSVALQALGYSTAAKTISSAIFLTGTTLGFGVAIVSAIALGVIVYNLDQAFCNR